MTTSKLISPGPDNWKRGAACKGADPDLFFPAPETPTSKYEEAYQYCRRCVCRSDCLQYAQDNNIEVGIWGGLSGQARQDLRKGNRRRRVEW